MQQKAKFEVRRGSALLIVLGMLSFMIISAVAFSAWMRAGRLPNSFLRRSSAARMLAKAALAAAIDEVDVSIGNNPHPGVGRLNYSYRQDGCVRGTGKSANRNLWLGRVFIGYDEDDNNDSDTARDHLVTPENTVSTLTLEGLAYIPPPFVSEARYYSRRSNAAKWHDLPFDSGRYAFTAIDVSDCLDVNRVAAGVGRSSSPYGRISLAYLFENLQHTSYKTDPKKWDDFMRDVFLKKTLPEVEVDAGEASGSDLVSNDKVPVTSVADLNLALYADGTGTGLESPFSKYVDQSGSSFYGGSTPTSDEGERIRSMAFVANSWLPPAQTRTIANFDQPQLDLADEVNQPFLSADLAKNRQMTVMAVAEKFSSGTATVGARLYKRLSGMGLVLLKDFLDEDDVPTSLAIPQVERTPMVAAIKHNFTGSSLAVKMTKEPEQGNETDDNYPLVVTINGDKTSRTIRKICRYSFDPTKFVQGIEGGFQALVVYPFRNGRDRSDADTFQIDAHVDFFLSSEAMQLRTGNRGDVFHSDNMGTDGKFAVSSYQNGFFRVGYTSQSCTFNNVTDEQSAMKLVSFTSPGASSRIVQALNSTAARLFEVTWQVKQTRTKDEETGNFSPWQNEGAWQRVAATCGFTPLNASGSVDPSFATGDAVLTYLTGNHAKTANIRAAITVRIKNGDGKVVDLAPAGLLDDNSFNSLNNLGAMEEMGNVISGRPGPLLLLNGGAMTLGDTEYDSNPGDVAFDLAPKGMMCADPRWNWAPEHWFVQETVDANAWLQNCQVGKDGRDRDIFMMTSDARYMQSVYELACLPRLTTFENYGNDALRGNMDNLGSATFTAIPAQFSDTRNNHLMWKTYNPYYRRGVKVNGVVEDEYHPDYNDAYRDPFERLNLVNRGGGFRVNPFSDSVNVVEAALANTPTDWWAAGLDPDGQAGVSDSTRKNAKQFNQEFAFSEMNTKARFAWNDVKRIANNIVKALHCEDVTSLDDFNPNEGIEMFWQNAFDERLDWSGDLVNGSGNYADYFGLGAAGVTGADNSVLDSETVDLYDVDRKFLYGYWRECFAARQQLFLVFVRAEPMMMGGGAVGAVPPQLGSRAVALVWREPEAAPGHESDIKYPHRTRVLFYRQLD